MTKLSICSVLLLILSSTSCIDCSKILVFSPTLSRSHMISNARVADSLAKDGHNVTLMEVEYLVPLGALNASKLARVVQVPGPYLDTSVDIVKMLAKSAFETPSTIFKHLHDTIFHSVFQTVLTKACEDFVLSQKELFAQMKAEQFDMFISEPLIFCGAGVSHLLGISTHIVLSSGPITEDLAHILGLPNPSSFVPAIHSNKPDQMTIWQRLDNLITHWSNYYSNIRNGIDFLTQMFRRHFGPQFPDIKHIVKESPVVLVAVDEFVDFPRPIFPNVVYIGGIGMEQAKKTELKEPFKTEMSKGAKGVVFFSMGSVMRSSDMDERFRRNIFHAFAQLPDYHFIVKIEKSDNFSKQLAAGIDNVFTTSWAPQAEMLVNPRLKLFISHGGYNSLMESARAGIPLICMGFFADQHRNARVAERNGWGLPFEKRQLLADSKEFVAAIQTVLENPSYATQAKRIQKLVLNKPFSAEERLQKTIRFLEISGGKLPELLNDPFINPTIVTFIGLIGVLINILVIICYAMMAVKKFYFRRENSSHHKSILKTLMIIMGIQVCGWITTFLASLFLGRYQQVIDYGMLHILYNAVSCLASLSSTVEVPALYFTSTEHKMAFRKEYMTIVGKFTNKNGTNSVTSIKVMPARNVRNANLSN